MPTAAGTSVADVRGVIETDATDAQIEEKLADAEFKIDHSVTVELETDHRQQLEKYLAAYLIRAVRDRDAESVRDGDAKVDWDGSPLDELRRQVQRLDPSGELAATVRRNTDRHITSTRSDD